MTSGGFCYNRAAEIILLMKLVSVEGGKQVRSVYDAKCSLKEEKSIGNILC